MNNLSGKIPLVFDYMIIDFGALGLQASVFHLEVKKGLQCLSHAYTRELSTQKLEHEFNERSNPSPSSSSENEKDPAQTSSTPLTEIDKLLKTLSCALTQAKNKSGNLNLHYVLWTGGSSQLPIFQSIVKDFFKNQSLPFSFCVD